MESVRVYVCVTQKDTSKIWLINQSIGSINRFCLCFECLHQAHWGYQQTFYFSCIFISTFSVHTNAHTHIVQRSLVARDKRLTYFWHILFFCFGYPPRFIHVSKLWRWWRVYDLVCCRKCHDTRLVKRQRNLFNRFSFRPYVSQLVK